MPIGQMVADRPVPQFVRGIVLFWAVCGALGVAQAQNQVSPPKKPVPTKIYPELLVLVDQVVEGQWKASLGLVNAPLDLKRIEPGQCIRFGVLASGDDRDQLLASTELSFEFSFAGHSQSFAAGLPEAVKQVKPEGGDFVAQALAAAGVKAPSLSVVSIAGSQAKWCVPLDTQDGTATIRATVVTPDGKSVELNPRSVDVATYATARKNPPFKDMNTFAQWLQTYHAAPDPAALLPGIRIVAAEEKARLVPDIMVFFVEALRASSVAGDDLLRALPTEATSVRTYATPLLSLAGYPTGPLLNGFTEDEKAAINSVHLPDPFNLKPDRELPNRMDMIWATFFATGKIEPVRAIVSMLAWRADYDKFQQMQKSGKKPTELTESIMRAVSYGAAGWSLNALSRSDGLVADYIDALKVSPDTPADVKVELDHLVTNPAFTQK
jgi:hypothetical protein